MSNLKTVKLKGTESRMAVTRGWKEKRTGSYYSKDTNFWLYKRNKS